jgi:hypothetical protein
MRALLPFLVAPVLAAQALPQEWDKALTSLKQALSKATGMGAVVMVERLDPQTLRFRAQCVGTMVRRADFSSRMEGKGYTLFALESPKGMDMVMGTARAGEDIAEVEVWLRGEEFSPTLRVRAPKSGEKAEVATVIAASQTK